MSVELGPKGTRGLTPPKGLRPLIRAMMGLSQVAFRLLGKRMKVQGRPLLALKTIGAKSGKPRQTILAYFPDKGRDDTWLIVGSNAGAAQHPGWVFNLAKNPNDLSIEVGGKQYHVRAESLKGSEREDAWQRVVSMAASYGRYETKTDRIIPIIRLTRVD